MILLTLLQEILSHSTTLSLVLLDEVCAVKKFLVSFFIFVGTILQFICLTRLCDLIYRDPACLEIAPCITSFYRWAQEQIPKKALHWEWHCLNLLQRLVHY